MSKLQRMKLLKFALILNIFLSSCSANHYSIYRAEKLTADQSTVITADAKQRFLLSNVITKTTEMVPATLATSTIPAEPAIPATTEHIRRYCAEPSPDVFTVLGQSASGGLSYGQTTDPKALNVALQGAFSSTEAGSTISRTQTINMLKEMMYRTCESYLNGQISDDEYPVIAARDQRIMTSILAIEQLTGTVLPKPVIIATSGSASTGQTTSEAILALDNAGKKVDEKKSALNTAQDALDLIDKPTGTCETLKAKKTSDRTTDEQAKLDQCNDKQSKLEVAKKELKDAQDRYDRISNLAGKPGVSSATTSAQLLASTSATETDFKIESDRTQRISTVASVVKEIVSNSFQQDETAFFCYRVLGRQKLDPSLVSSGAVTICNEYFRARVYEQSQLVNQQTAKTINETARINLETDKTIKQMDELRKSSFEKFWDKVKDSSGNLDQAKLKTLLNSKFPTKASKPLQDKLDAMKLKTTKDELFKIFNTLPLWVNDELLKD